MSLPRPLLAVVAAVVLCAALALPLPVLWIDAILVLTVVCGCVAASGSDGRLARSAALTGALATTVAASRRLAAGMQSEPRDPWPPSIIESIGEAFAGGNVVIGSALAALVVLAVFVTCLVVRAGRLLALASLVAASLVPLVAFSGYVFGGTPFELAMREGADVAIGISIALLVPAIVAASRTLMRRERPAPEPAP